MLAGNDDVAISDRIFTLSCFSLRSMASGDPYQGSLSGWNDQLRTVTSVSACKSTSDLCIVGAPLSEQVGTSAWLHYQCQPVLCFKTSHVRWKYETEIIASGQYPLSGWRARLS
jgi:hypothetical protein